MRPRNILLMLVALLPHTAFAAIRDLHDLADKVTGYINDFVGILITLTVVVYFYRIALGMSDIKKDPKKRREFIVWGIFILFIMVSIWGIVALLQNALFGGEGTTPTYQEDTSSSQVCPFGNC